MSRIRESVKALRNRKAKQGHTGPKSPRKIIPLVRREEIVQQHLLGKTQRRIARDLGHSRDSVSKIISEANIPEYVEKVRGQFVGLGTLAVAALKKEMESGNWRLAYKFLSDTGIIADIEGRTIAAQVAGVNPATTQLTLSEETKAAFMASLSESERNTFKILSMFARKSEAYGMPDYLREPPIGLNSQTTEVPARQEETKGA